MQTFKLILLITIIFLQAQSCKKEPINYTNDMAGTRTMSGTRYDFNRGVGLDDTTYSVTFGLTIIAINDTKIQFKYDNYTYSDTLSYTFAKENNNILYFTYYSHGSSTVIDTIEYNSIDKRIAFYMYRSFLNEGLEVKAQTL